MGQSFPVYVSIVDSAGGQVYGLVFKVMNYLVVKNYINGYLRTNDDTFLQDSRVCNLIYNGEALLARIMPVQAQLKFFAWPDGNVEIYNKENKLILRDYSFSSVDWNAQLPKYVTNEFEKYKDKVVSFKYSAGTKPGAKRIVKISEVTDTLIKGVDVEVGEPRQYKISDIVKNTVTQISE